LPHERPTPPLPRADHVVDASDLVCPGPIVELAKAIRTAEIGPLVEIIATDPGSWRMPLSGPIGRATPSSAPSRPMVGVAGGGSMLAMLGGWALAVQRSSVMQW
jgi:hypothetical protein